MATSLRHLILVSLLLQSILFIKVRGDDDKEGDLLRGINSYRATLKLESLTKNEQAECFSEKMADEFKDQPCTNSSGPGTVPGTETNFKDYPNLLGKCKLNVTTTSGGAILPACVPGLDRALLLSNYTLSQYSRYLNDSKYTGIGIGSEDDWVVVILTTNTPDGNYAPDTSLAIHVSKMGLIFCHTLLLVTLVMLLTGI